MKKTFTGKTRLFLCISGAIIAVALIMQIVGVGMNLGIDFTGGSILSYSVGENYDVNDVITILQSAGYNDQPTKAAPSAASIALQQELAAKAAEAAEETAEAVEEAAEDAAEDVEETVETTEEEAIEDEAEEEDAEAEATEEEAFTPMLNLDKSGIASDGLTDLQIRLKLADATAGMEETIANAVKGVVSGAEQTSYRNATNLEVSDLGYDLTYAGGKIIEFKLGEDFDKAAIETAVNGALEAGGYSLNAIQFVK